MGRPGDDVMASALIDRLDHHFRPESTLTAAAHTA